MSYRIGDLGYLNTVFRTPGGRSTAIIKDITFCYRYNTDPFYLDLEFSGLRNDLPQ